MMNMEIGLGVGLIDGFSIIYQAPAYAFEKVEGMMVTYDLIYKSGRKRFPADAHRGAAPLNCVGVFQLIQKYFPRGIEIVVKPCCSYDLGNIRQRKLAIVSRRKRFCLEITATPAPGSQIRDRAHPDWREIKTAGQ